jgi:pyruvate dehydrogenase E1 component alpha subunit
MAEKTAPARRTTRSGTRSTRARGAAATEAADPAAEDPAAATEAAPAVGKGWESEPPETLRDYYRQMWLIRRFEERCIEMYQRAKIGGYCHLNLGEEATVVGLIAGTEPRDYLFTNYREHGYAIAKGMAPGPVMAELFGKATGVSGGWGGSMHLFDVRTRLLGGYAIVGGQIPLATGVALANSYRGQDDVVLCQMGDATTNIGAWHESLNLAAIWNLPIVFVVINNFLGMGTRVEWASGEPELYKRGAAFRMPGVRVDGNDVLAVREATRSAVEAARRGEPSILELVSYRMRGHSVVDPARYRSKEDTERAMAADPVAATRARLVGLGVFDEGSVKALEDEVEQEVQAAIQFADDSPAPEVSTLFDKVYASPVANFARHLPGDPVVAS